MNNRQNRLSLGAKVYLGFPFGVAMGNLVAVVVAGKKLSGGMKTYCLVSSAAGFVWLIVTCIAPAALKVLRTAIKSVGDRLRPICEEPREEEMRETLRRLRVETRWHRRPEPPEIAVLLVWLRLSHEVKRLCDKVGFYLENFIRQSSSPPTTKLADFCKTLETMASDVDSCMRTTINPLEKWKDPCPAIDTIHAKVCLLISRFRREVRGKLAKSKEDYRESQLRAHDAAVELDALASSIQDDVSSWQNEIHNQVKERIAELRKH